MKKLALGLFLAIAACGGGGSNNGDDTGGSDAGSGTPIDAPAACQVFADDGAQGCPSGEKCTWIVDDSSTDTGHLGCANAGTAEVGSACSFSGSGGDGFDNCVTGSFCISGSCETICDNMGTQKSCDSSHACATYVGIFGPPAGPDTAGVCDPTCDPLTQDANAPIDGATTACGSPHPCNGPGSGSDGSCGSAGPEVGCYPVFSEGNGTCANSPEGRGDPGPTDGVECTTSNDCAASGGAYLNGCAPGFVVVLRESTQVATAICSGLCAPLDSDSATPGNAPGDGTALGKLPADPMAVAGHAKCTPGGKAKAAGEECLFGWQLLADGDSMNFADTLGVCWNPSNYQYDPTGGSNATTNTPHCAVLKPGTVAEAEAKGPSGSGVACEAINGSGDYTGSNADCYAVEHGCYTYEETFGSGSGSGTLRLDLQRAAHHESPLHLSIASKGMMFRRQGGIR